jgi:hypothetical protein
VLAEFFLVQFDQPPAMLALLARHFREHVGARRVVLTEPLGNVCINTAVLLLIGNRQCENLPFGEIRKIAHGRNLAGGRQQSSEPRNDANASQQQF